MPPPETLVVDHADGLVLERARLDDADAIARAVGESLEHLARWMPWAVAGTADDPQFQAERLRTVEAAWEDEVEFSYLLRRATDAGAGRAVLGAMGLMTRRGPLTLEIGYWVHAAVARRGYARAAAAALTDAALALVPSVFIYCDAANRASAAIPRALGYALAEVRPEPCHQPAAPNDSGSTMIWIRRRPTAPRH
jgi:RimJ/RimL family protein N-acetyltransferase